jgi:hypothetical protein
VAQRLPVTAETLWTRGAGHLVGVRVLIGVALEEYGTSEEGKQLIFNGQYSPAIHLLIGFSFELLLKAAFLAAGGHADQVEAFKHDLKRALNEAETAGFVFSHPKTRWVVERLHDSHMNHAFRYGWLTQLAMPQLEDSLPVLESLAEEVRVRLPE